MPACSRTSSTCCVAPCAATALGETGGALRCAAGHSFDIARQGYVNLVPGRADTPEMVEARDAFLRAGHFRGWPRPREEAAGAEDGGGRPGRGRMSL